MLAENIVLYLQNTHFVLLFNILCIEFHETFCEASLYYSQHLGCKKLRYSLLWKGEKSHWCKDWGWCKDRSMTVIPWYNCTSFRSPVFAGPPSLRYGGLTSFAHLLRSGCPAQPVNHSLLGAAAPKPPLVSGQECFLPTSKPFVAYV